MPIIFHSEQPSFKLKNKTRIRHWLQNVVAQHKGTIRCIQYIFCDDAYLLEINQQYLRHSTLTDIITFRYEEFPHPLHSDIYISIERVKENAVKFGVSFELELNRVLVHGVLHLLGYKDKSGEEKKKMRLAEDAALALWINESP